MENMGFEQIIFLVLALNSLLSGLQKSLEFIKDKTETKADNQAYDIITKALNILSVIISWMSARPKK